MKKNLLYRLQFALCVLFFSVSLLHAEPVDPEKATLVAKHFFQSTRSGQALAENVNLSLVYGNKDGYNQIYIFNVNGNSGFVIVAADDAVTPILGYSDKGGFNPDDIPTSMAKWLEGYKREIFYVVENKIKATNEITASWKSFQAGPQNKAEGGGQGPLLETTWDQRPNENMFCPGGSVTGCVATAMAQVMYYWKHPVQGRGTHSYIENDYGTLQADFGSAIYQWGVMPWHPTSPNSDISLLMLHCGISVDMNYSPQGSGSLTTKVADALKKYFKYDPNTVKFVERQGYSDADWIDLLKLELNASRPMQYKGTGSGGGHSFVCDGYDNNNLFHFNWGWGGSSDGFFAINALNPGSLGAGGGTGGFNSGQGAIIGIQPDPAIQPELQMNNNLTLQYFLGASPNIQEATPLVITAFFSNSGSQPFSGSVTLGIYDHNGNLVFNSPTIYEYVGIGGAGALISNEPFEAFGLPPGGYTASLVYKLENTDQWIKIPDGAFSNTANFHIISGSNVTIFEKPVATLQTVKQNQPFSITAKVQNVSTSFPLFVGTISADLHKLDGSWVQEISNLTNQAVVFLGAPLSLNFNSSGLNVAPGTYRIVLWATDNTGSTVKVSVPVNFDATAFLTVQAAPPPPDAYEPNNNQAAAKVMPLNFAGNIALISTFGSNNHVPDDEDYYKIIFPSDPTFFYKVTGKLNDNQNPGFPHTNDFFWRFNNGNNWSEIYEDQLLLPGGFQMGAGSEAYFFVKPVFAGTVGTYLLELEVTRIKTVPNDQPCAAILLPVNGVVQTGYDNINATVTNFEPAIPTGTNCLTAWCSEETGERLLHSIWFKFVAPASGAVEISTCGLANFDTQLALYSTSECFTPALYTLLAANDDGNGCTGFTSRLTKTGLTPGQTYYILVDGFENETGNLGIKITAMPASSVQNLPASSDILSVSPNPSSGMLNITLHGTRSMDGYLISDINGKKLKTANFSQGVQEETISLDGLPKGIYLLQIRSGDQIFTQKVVLQ
jgi:hypothetical protein